MGIISRLLGVDSYESAKANGLGIVAPADAGGSGSYLDLPVATFGGSYTTAWSGGVPVVDPGTQLGAHESVNVRGIWESQPNIRKVVDFIARNVASVPIKAYERVADDDRARVQAPHPLVAVLAQPQPGLIPYRFWHSVMTDYLLYDRWAALKTPNGDGISLTRIPPRRLVFKGDSLGRVTAVSVWSGPDKGWEDYDPAEFVFDFGYTPDSVGGLSPLRTLSDILDESAEAVAFRRQVWRNGARSPQVIERPLDAPEWEKSDRERFLAEFVSQYTGHGSRAGAPAMLEDGMSLHDVPTFNSKDSQDLEGRKLTAIECAGAYHIAPELVGAQQGNYSNVREYRQMLYRDSLGPYIVAIEQALNMHLVPQLAGDRPLYAEANVESKLRGSFEEQAVVMQAAVGAPIMTRNEGRALRNLPAIEGGDELITPLNVLVGGQASPTDSGSQNRGPKAVRLKSLKSSADRLREEYQADVAKFVARQQSVVMANLGAKSTPPLADSWDTDRWDRELAAITFRRMKRASDFGSTEVLAQVEGEADFDPDQTAGWISEAARNVAGSWNAKTYDALGAAVQESDWKSSVTNVFAAAAGGRALYLATTTSTDAGNFGRNEAAGSAGLRMKTWIVASGNPRSAHSLMDGETVPMSETFSNGARWPGDASLPDEERANCQCQVNFESGS